MSDSAQQAPLQQAKKDVQAALKKFENVEKEARKQWLRDVRFRLTDDHFLPWTVANSPAYTAAERQYNDTYAKYKNTYSSIDREAAEKDDEERVKAKHLKDEARKKQDAETLKDPFSIKDEDIN